jgi:hypothetical protein
VNEVVGRHQRSDDGGIVELTNLEPVRVETTPDAHRSGSPRKTKYERKREVLELEKLGLEIDAAQHDQLMRPEKEEVGRKKESLGLRQLEQDIQHKRRMDRLEERKAILEIKEKRLATRFGISTWVWDILKYLVAIIPVLVTAGTFYEQYRKDTFAERRQTELDLKFKLDDKVIKLIGELSKTRAEAVNAALLLPVYGSAVTRIIIPNLKADWSSSYLIRALVDVVAGESDEVKRRDAATEVVQRLVDQSSLIIKDFLVVPTDPAQRALVKVQVDALLQLMNECATVCNVLRTTVLGQASRINTLLDSVEARRGDIKNEDLMTSIKELKDALAARPNA